MSDSTGFPTEEKKSPLHRVLIHLRNTLLAGVVVIIPLVVTIFVLELAYRVINSVSEPWLKRFKIEFEGLPFFMTLLIVYLLGLMATNMIGRQVLEGFERLLARLPIVATIYAGVKQIMDTLRTFNAGMNFKRVVYVPYLTESSYLLGYVTGVYVRESDGKEITNVYIPTSPNPTMGLLLMVESEKVINADLTMEQASKLILSAGLLTPNRVLPSQPQAPSN